MTRLSHDERKTLIESFYRRVADGLPLGAEMREKIMAGVPRLPDDPSPGQLDAWVELSELISDGTFAEALRANAAEISKRGLSLGGLQRLNDEVAESAAAVQAQGAAPTSAAARALVERYIAGLAEVTGQSADDAAFRSAVHARFARQDPRMPRYWTLIGTLDAEHPMARHAAAWGFLVEALEHHLAS